MTKYGIVGNSVRQIGLFRYLPTEVRRFWDVTDYPGAGCSSLALDYLSAFIRLSLFAQLLQSISHLPY